MEEDAPQNPGGTFPPEMLKDETSVDSVDEPTGEFPVTDPDHPEHADTPYQSVEKVAIEVAQGRWGVGQARRSALKRAGYDPNAVDEEVKKILNRR